MLELYDVSKGFYQAGRSIEVLRNANLKVIAKSKVSIVGESGSGKSTLLGLLAGLDRPDKGSVIIDGVDISKFREKNLTSFRGRNIGIVFQQYHLIPYLNALENVVLPLEINGISSPEELAKEALLQVGLADRMTHFSHELSGGECQRVALARAIVHRPKLLLADEPSGNLDVKTGHEVMELMFNVVSENQMTLVLVTHNSELASQCQYSYNLVNGQLEVKNDR